MLVNDVRDVRYCWVTCDNERSSFSPCHGFVFKCVSARNVRSPLYLGLEKGFVVTAISEVVYKFIST